MVTAGAAGAGPPTISHSWIESASATTATSYGELVATWTVPPDPASDDGQTVFFFPGLEDFKDVVSILQPVLGWNNDFGEAWSIASWNCCPHGITVESSPVSVSAGDEILGTMRSTCSAGTLSCATWNVISEDVSTGQSTTLSNTLSEGQTFNWAFAGALEVYNIAQCSDYPPNGFLTFSDLALYDDEFDQISDPSWSISNSASGLTPQCGYGGQVAATQVMLDYSSSKPAAFVPVTPCRLVDTRASNGEFGSPALVGGSSRNFTIPSSTTCTIPSTATAYSLNVTVVPEGKLSYLTVWPTGETQPVASTLNSEDGRIKANAAIVPAGTGGAISVYATNATNLVLDIDGYFVPAGTSGALAFYPLTPCRLADTRSSSYGPMGSPSLTAGEDRTFAILSSTCDVPDTAQAYSLNFTAVPSGPLGYLTAFPTGQTMPLASTLNAPTGTTTANAAIVPAGSSGSVDIYTTNAMNLVIDINGYFAPPGTGGLSLYNLTPCRVLDTRQPPGSLPFTGEKDVNVTASGCGAPASAKAYVFNATVVPPGPMGYLTLWPQGGTEPLASTLNALDGAITSNMAIVPTTNGSIAAKPSSATQLVLDLFGYFAP